MFARWEDGGPKRSGSWACVCCVWGGGERNFPGRCTETENCRMCFKTLQAVWFCRATELPESCELWETVTGFNHTWFLETFITITSDPGEKCLILIAILSVLLLLLIKKNTFKETWAEILHPSDFPRSYKDDRFLENILSGILVNTCQRILLYQIFFSPSRWEDTVAEISPFTLWQRCLCFKIRGLYTFLKLSKFFNKWNIPQIKMCIISPPTSIFPAPPK